VTKKKPYIVGIAGGSASGKTTFIRDLKKHYRDKELCIISQDHYYKALSEQSIDNNGNVNFDLPQGIDFKRLIKDVNKLKSGKVAEIVEYTFNNPNKFPQTIRFQPAPIIIVEGLFIYTDPKLSKLFNLKLFIDAEMEVMLERRLRRDTNERAYTEEQIRYQWDFHVKPSYEQYLLPYRNEVDLVIVNNKSFKQGLEVLRNHLNKML
jgi:uridine kinase